MSYKCGQRRELVNFAWKTEYTAKDISTRGKKKENISSPVCFYAAHTIVAVGGHDDAPHRRVRH